MVTFYFFDVTLKGLSYEIDFENVDENGQILACVDENGQILA